MATSPVTAFNLKRLCGDCQFRADRVPFLTQERCCERCINVGRKEGVHNVHTWGFAFGCTGAGLGRMGVWGPGKPVRLCGEQPTTADRVPPVGPLLWAGAGIGAAISARHHIAVREFFDDGTEHLSRFTVDPTLAGLEGSRRGWPQCRRPESSCGADPDDLAGPGPRCRTRRAVRWK
jgi:hypothetical protein